MREVSLGVVIVTFNSGDEALDCLESLLSGARGSGLALDVVVVDNASTDDTVAQIRAWADGETPYAPPSDLPFDMEPLAKPLVLHDPANAPPREMDLRVTLLESSANCGFAGGVNLGLADLARRPELQHFWVLNPDSMVPPEAMTALANRLNGIGPYALMGGRVTYLDQPDRIQIDGGTIDRKTGVTGNINLGCSHAETPPPDVAELDFIMGASMVASRAFYEDAGPMREDYFLYYEEVDWAMRRGTLPLLYCPGLRIYHRAGSAIGSPKHGRPASPFSLYFKHRSRMRFIRRFLPRSLWRGYAYSLAYAARLLWRRAPTEAWAVITASFGLAPPDAVRARLGPAAAELAFAPMQD